MKFENKSINKEKKCFYVKNLTVKIHIVVFYKCERFIGFVAVQFDALQLVAVQFRSEFLRLAIFCFGRV